jgi:hypothetical protein
VLGRHPQPGFFVATEEELEAAESQLLSDVEAGVESHEVDGQRTQLADPTDRYEVLKNIRADAIAADPTSNPLGGMRIQKLVPPGCG